MKVSKTLRLMGCVLAVGCGQESGVATTGYYSPVLSSDGGAPNADAGIRSCGFDAGSCTVSTPLSWTKIEVTNGPSERAAHAMVYDGSSKKVLLFGGHKAEPLNEHWEYDGARKKWERRTPSTFPPARTRHAMAYDASRDTVVLFGGDNQALTNSFLDDTWEWDGKTSRWTRRNVSSSPPARARHAMAYDASTQRVVLFGGWDGTQRFRDTWEWDGHAGTWTRVGSMTGPSRRDYTAMAYDEASKKIVLFGGEDDDTTWEYDGQSQQWAPREALRTPPARRHHSMIYDVARRKVILFGGQTWLSGEVNDTWEWDSAQGEWTELAKNPQMMSRGHHAMAYDVSTSRIVLFGGFGFDGTMGRWLSDTWEFGP